MKYFSFLRFSRSCIFSFMISLTIMLVLNPSGLKGGDFPAFHAGVSTVDITPPIGCILSGYSVEGDRRATGVMHPLYAKIIVVSDSHTTAAIVTLDLLNLQARTVNEIRHRIRVRTGIPTDHIMLASSHTHAGPLVGKAWNTPDAIPDPDPDYMRLLEEKISMGAAEALRNMQPALFEYGEGKAYINVNRRLMVDGEIQMRPNPEGIVDRRVRVLQFKAHDSGKPYAVFMHYPCHPNVMRGDNTLISGDFVSPAKEYVENKIGCGCTALYAQGCTGNIRPNFISHDGKFLSGKKADVDSMGKELGKEVVRVCREDMKQLDDITVQAAITALSLPAKKGGTIDSEIQAIRIGGLWIFTLPGEPFIDLALQIEEQIPKNVMVIGYANDSIGYLCTEASYPEGGYEPTVSFVKKESESIIVSTAIDLYRSMVNN